MRLPLSLSLSLFLANLNLVLNANSLHHSTMLSNPRDHRLTFCPVESSGLSYQNLKAWQDQDQDHLEQQN
mgnify:CR=1 FL=1